MDHLFQQIYLHSFVAFCYQEGKYNPSDVLKPLVKKVVATLGKTNFTAAEIHDELKSNFTKDFPYILVERELGKLVHDEILLRNPEGKTNLTYTLIADLTDIKDEYMKSQNETDFFLAEFQDFLSEKGSSYSTVKLSALFKRFENFCSDNIIPIIQYFGGINSSIKTKNETKEIDSLIEEFFETRVKNNERLCNEFENIFNGITLLKIAETCSDNLRMTDYSIGKKVFYLDTNILLRILELQSDYLNVLGKELFELLKNYEFKIRVFKNTLDEFFYLLRGYKRAYYFFIKGRNISHVYQTLKNRDVEPFQIDDLISEIPEKLLRLGIEIDDKTEYIPNDYGVFDEKISELAKLKYDKKNESDSEFDMNDFDSQRYILQAKHDLEAIELIRTLRASPVINRFEDAEYYFITAESNLLRFNKQKYHYTNIDETIGDYALSFLLYFYKPGNMKGVSLRSFIAANCSNKQLSIVNWISYVKNVNKKYKEGSINKSQFGYLLTRTILNNEKFTDNDLDDIVNDGITEFNAIVDDYENIKKEKAILLNKEQEKDIQHFEDAEYITNLENEKGALGDEVKNLGTQVSTLEDNVGKLKKQMGFLRIVFFVVFGVIFIFGIAGLFSSNKILGTTLTIVSIIGTVTTIIDRFKKWFIKD